jgi:hypothetical protein
MSFCMACGCERTGANHFCNGCGAEFGEPADGDEIGPWVGDWAARASLAGPADQLARDRAAPGSLDGPADQALSGTATRPDAGIGLLDSLLTPPDPSWDDWYVRPGIQPAAEERSPEYAPSGWRRRIVIALTAAVILAALSGAAVFELNHGHARLGARAAGTSDAGVHARTPRLAASSAPGAGSSASNVAVAPPAADDAAVPQVKALLRRYFTAINQHDYAAYASLLDPQVLQQSTAAAFYSGDGSTTDSDETLTGISAAGAGGVAATVTFTSHQQPVDSPDNSACDDWSITLYLVPDGAGYLIGLPPSGYQASYTSC